MCLRVVPSDGDLQQHRQPRHRLRAGNVTALADLPATEKSAPEPAALAPAVLAPAGLSDNNNTIMSAAVATVKMPRPKTPTAFAKIAKYLKMKGKVGRREAKAKKVQEQIVHAVCSVR
ncbi:hypothetical protein ONE63_001451 [Megalurothrips usitatus]|uniref:60S ribosomal protein L29 n=1 Tax=Megalurothrips usitatus TaxID=439358 RepID=A0AAV7XGC3_9NEOP|nr:hypothetical protein ONE63_001451 [Megalurothrips usitatus]